MLFKIFNKLICLILTIVLPSSVLAHTGNGQLHHHFDAFSLLFIFAIGALVVVLGRNLYRK